MHKIKSFLFGPLSFTVGKDTETAEPNKGEIIQIK